MTKDKEIQKYLFDSDKNIFLTGQAGTGKSTLLKKYIETHKNTIVCAPTGVAAVNVGGDTMHKVFSIPVPAYGANISKVTPSKIKELIMADCVIIDEISMARNDVFSFAMRVLKKAEKLKGKKIRVILCGDFSQLPPVVRKEDIKYLKKFGYDISGFAFTTKEWKALNLKTIELIDIKRQSDKTFIEELNKVRIGDLSCIPYFNSFLTDKTPKDAICVCGTNAEADRLNKEYLDSIEGAPIAYQAEKSGRTANSNIDEIILLKKGAKVFFTINDVVNEEYRNGTFGIVKDLNEKCVTVDIDGKEVIVFPHKNSIYSYKVENGMLNKKEIGSVSQIPLKLAKAITIHKSQGKTFDNVLLSPQIFAPGQLYVALSRVRNPENFYLSTPIVEEYIKLDPIVQKFYDNGYTYEIKKTTTTKTIRTTKTTKTVKKPKTTKSATKKTTKPAVKRSTKTTKKAVKPAKTTTKRSVTKKVATKKKPTTTKTTVKRTNTTIKKTNKKPVTKKKTTPKATSKPKTTAKKPTAKKPVIKKPAVKKTVAKKTPVTKKRTNNKATPKRTVKTTKTKK